MEESTVFHIVRITPEVRVDYSVINVEKLPSDALQDIKKEEERLSLKIVDWPNIP